MKQKLIERLENIESQLGTRKSIFSPSILFQHPSAVYDYQIALCLGKQCLQTATDYPISSIEHKQLFQEYNSWMEKMDELMRAELPENMYEQVSTTMKLPIETYERERHIKKCNAEDLEEILRMRSYAIERLLKRLL